MSNITDNPNIQPVKVTATSGVFTNYIYKAIPLAFDESMSYYETLCALKNYLANTMLPAVNNNADAVAELQGLYVQLNDYVTHYFDNLDVQEEINNKLDDMVQNGELQAILNNLFDDLREETETRLDEQNTRLNNIQNQVNAIAGGSPQVVTSTSQMTDTSKIYVLSTDGKWYYNNGTSWVAGGTYQPSSTSLDNIRNEIPLSTNTTNYFIKEIYLQGYDNSKNIEVRSLRKAWYDSAGDHRYHTDFTLKYSDDPTNANIGGFGYTKNTEALSLQDANISIYTLTPQNNSGITGYVIIDYNQVETGSRILNPSPHIVLNPNKYQFLPNNPTLESYMNKLQMNDYMPYTRQRIKNTYSIGHQGFGAGQNGYRGNSLTGFKKGAIFGFDCLECDIKVTSDNKLVLNHNETITDDNNTTYTIAETTYNELRSHLYGGETICSLEEYLNVCKIFGVDAEIDAVYSLLHNSTAYALMKSLIYQYSMQSRVIFGTLQMWRGGDVPVFNQQLCEDFPKATLLFKNEDTTWTADKFNIVQEDYIDTYKMKVMVGGPYNTTYSPANMQVAQAYPDMKIGFYTIDTLNEFYTISRRCDWFTSDIYTGRNILLSSQMLN